MTSLVSERRSAIDQELPPPAWLGQLPVIGTGAEKAWLLAAQQGTGLAPALAPYLAPLREWALPQGASLLAATLHVPRPHRMGRVLDGVEWAFRRQSRQHPAPYLISRGIRMTMVLIFLGVLGGLLTSGSLASSWVRSCSRSPTPCSRTGGVPTRSRHED